MMTGKPCDYTSILHERSWKVPKSAKLGRSKYWSVIVTLTDANTQIHTLCAQTPNPQQGTQPDTKCAKKIHTIACYSYITNNVVLFSRIQTVSKRVGDDEYTMYITHYYQFNWYGSVTGHFFLWVSKMHLICGYFSSLNIDWIDQIARNLVKFLSTFGHVQSSSWKSYLLF